MASRMKDGQLNSREKARSGRVRFVEWRALFVAGTRRGNETRTYPASSFLQFSSTGIHAIAVKVFAFSRNMHIVELIDGRLLILNYPSTSCNTSVHFKSVYRQERKSRNFRLWSKVLSVARLLGHFVYHAQRRVFETSAGWTRRVVRTLAGFAGAPLLGSFGPTRPISKTRSHLCTPDVQSSWTSVDIQLGFNLTLTILSALQQKSLVSWKPCRASKSPLHGRLCTSIGTSSAKQRTYLRP